jgi:hypothetical protein
VTVWNWVTGYTRGYTNLCNIPKRCPQIPVVRLLTWNTFCFEYPQTIRRHRTKFRHPGARKCCCRGCVVIVPLCQQTNGICGHTQSVSGALSSKFWQVCSPHTHTFSALPICTVGRDRSVGVGTELRTGQFGDRIPVGVRFSATVQTDPGAHPACYTTGTRSFPGVKLPGRGVDHPPHLAPRLKKE